MELKAASRRAALAEDLRAELGAGENLVWLGGPDARATFRKMRPLLWTGIPWTAIAGIIAVFHGAGLVGMIMGLALAAGPFVNAWLAANTIYALTDRRAIVLCRPIGGRTLVSVDLAGADREPEILRSYGGCGTVLFASNLPPRRRYTDYRGKFGFWDVPDPDGVAAALRPAIWNFRR
jgi:hypothetical protein